MKYFILAFFIFIHFSFVSEENEKKFYQDVAIIHGTEKGLPEGPVNMIQLINEKPVALVQLELYEWNGDEWVISVQKKHKIISEISNLPENSGKVLTSIVYQGKKVIGCENGLFIETKGKAWAQILPSDDSYSWAPKNVAALAVDIKGRLWFGSREGVGCKSGDQWSLFTGKEGLPYTNFTCAAAGPGGEVWFGTEKGAIRAVDDYFYYRFSRRWLPDDNVLDIEVLEFRCLPQKIPAEFSCFTQGIHGALL